MERLTAAGAVYETDHDGRSVLRHHRHDVPFVTIVLDGAYVEVRDAVPEPCAAGSIVVHDAHEEHADGFSQPTRCLNVEFAPDGAVPQAFGNLALYGAPLRAAVDGLVGAFYTGTNDLESAVRRLQTVILDRCAEKSDDHPPWLRTVMSAFPWAQPLPLRDAASFAGVHETHFSREFRRYVGITASDYRARARLRLASQLLLTTTTSLAAVALQSGFSDQSHLTRAFTGTLGMAPAGYRRTFAR